MQDLLALQAAQDGLVLMTADSDALVGASTQERHPMGVMPSATIIAGNH